MFGAYMSDQLQRAIEITKSKIASLEDELRRERDFLSRLIPGEIRTSRRSTNRTKWIEVFAAIAAKPMKHEHIIDFIESCSFPMSRGATRVWLNDKMKREHLKRDKNGVYTATASGREWLKASSPLSASLAA